MGSARYYMSCRECPRCNGEGVIHQEVVSMPPYSTCCEYVECQQCGGEGVVVDELVTEREDSNV